MVGRTGRYTDYNNTKLKKKRQPKFFWTGRWLWVVRGVVRKRIPVVVVKDLDNEYVVVHRRALPECQFTVRKAYTRGVAFLERSEWRTCQ